LIFGRHAMRSARKENLGVLRVFAVKNRAMKELDTNDRNELGAFAPLR
jgi:hypothetical protein